ncbi:MAG: hypothetical protein GXP60_03250 [Epsilonproteobacteria bacterium]|nr:hypothetical protein [Campylobacterota bacterium]
MEEIIKNIGWPFVSLVFSIIFILLFRKSISTFITRIRSVGKVGFQVDAGTAVQREDEKRKQAIQELMDIDRSILRDEVEKSIVEDLQKKGLEVQGDTVHVLVRHLAATQIALDFEQIYSSIFGSQILLIRKLNEVTDQGLVRVFLEPYFEKLKELYPEVYAQWDMDIYLQYLLDSGLIIVKSSKCHITIKGQEFLVWLLKTGRKEDKEL